MYLLFSGAHYYPEGGAHDFVAAYDNLEQAKANAPTPTPYTWDHVAVLEGSTLTFVASRNSGGDWQE